MNEHTVVFSTFATVLIISRALMNSGVVDPASSKLFSANHSQTVMLLYLIGGAAAIGEAIYNISGDLAPWMLLIVLIALTMLLSCIINNSASAFLTAPVGLQCRRQLGGVCVSAADDRGGRRVLCFYDTVRPPIKYPGNGAR